DPHARRAPPLPRSRGPRPARGHSAAAQRGLNNCMTWAIRLVPKPVEAPGTTAPNDAGTAPTAPRPSPSGLPRQRTTGASSIALDSRRVQRDFFWAPPCGCVRSPVPSGRWGAAPPKLRGAGPVTRPAEVPSVAGADAGRALIHVGPVTE